jgi:hypothetical protein
MDIVAAKGGEVIGYSNRFFFQGSSASSADGFLQQNLTIHFNRFKLRAAIPPERKQRL